MGLFFKSDGLKSFHLASDRVYQRSFTTAYDFSTSSQDSFTSSLYGSDGSNSDSVFLSSAGTTLYILYTNYDNNTTNQGYMRSYTLATAWDLSSLSNPTTPTTITFPLGTEFSIHSGKSAFQRWSGLEFASDGLSFHFLRHEKNGSNGASTNTVTFKVIYTLSTAWVLSTATLTSTTKIDYATQTGYGGQCMGFHEMSGGEFILSMGANFIELDSITDTVANSTSALAGYTAFVLSTDESLLLQNGYDSCGLVHTEIETNYSSVTLTSFSASSGNKVNSTACGQSVDQTYYHDGSGALPTSGDVVYTDAAGTIPLPPNYYKKDALGTFRIVVTLGQPNDGIVDSLHLC